MIGKRVRLRNGDNDMLPQQLEGQTGRVIRPSRSEPGMWIVALDDEAPGGGNTAAYEDEIEVIG